MVSGFTSARRFGCVHPKLNEAFTAAGPAATLGSLVCESFTETRYINRSLKFVSG